MERPASVAVQAVGTLLGRTRGPSRVPRQGDTCPSVPMAWAFHRKKQLRGQNGEASRRTGPMEGSPAQGGEALGLEAPPVTSHLHLVSDSPSLSLLNKQACSLFCLGAGVTEHLGKRDANMGKIQLEHFLSISFFTGWVLIRSTCCAHCPVTLSSSPGAVSLFLGAPCPFAFRLLVMGLDLNPLH